MPKPAYVTPPELARLWRCSPEKIIDLIRSGQLDGIDLAAPGSSRPRFRISPEAVQRFEHCRSVAPRPAVERRQQAKPNVELKRFI
jgi:hypothetical protein